MALTYQKNSESKIQIAKLTLNDTLTLSSLSLNDKTYWNSYFTFTLLEDNTWSISPTDKNNLPSEVVIPSVFNGRAVTDIPKYAFSYCTSITSLVIEGSALTMGQGAFQGCSNITKVVLGNGVTNIGSNAFASCDNLVGIDIPDSVTWIGSYAFSSCSNLSWVVIPKSITEIGYNLFDYSDNLDAIYYEGTESEWAQISIGSNNAWAAIFGGVPRYYYSEFIPTTEGNYWHYVDSTPVVWGSACENGHAYECVTVDATCTEKGSKTYTCSVCGKSYVETIPALGHDWGDWTVTLEPTCTTEGNKRRTCKRDGCTSFQDTTISATGHTPSDWIIDKNANGSEDGSRHKVCTVCGTVLETEIIPAPYEPTAESYFTFALLEDDTYSIAAKDATNMPKKVFLPTEYNGKAVTVIGKHAFMDCTGIEYVFIPSSITTIGYGAFAYCYNLGTAWIPHTVTTVDYGIFAYTGTAVYIDIHYPPYPPTGWNEDWDMYLPEGAVHWGVSFSEMFNTSLLSDATYEVTATETALANEYIYIPDSHEGTDITSIGASAFAGSSATGVRIGDNITLIGKLAFSGAKMHMIKLPLKVDTIKPLAFSNMPEGTVIYCEANSKPNGWADDWCDDSVTVVWGDGCAAGHSYKSVVTPPTCITKGYTTHTCEECGHSYVDSYTDPTGVHNWSAWEETKAPQCTTEGEEKRTCSVCGATETRTIEATGHHYSISDEVGGTCTEKGYIVYTCDECLADSYRVEKELDPDNHDWDVEVEVVEPTCTEQGYTIHTCNACGETYKDNYTDMISHTYDLTLVEPTCTEQGYVDHICKDCGHSYKDAYTEALGHTPSEWIIDKEATVEAEGSKHKECTVCGVTLETATIPKVDDSIYLVTEAGEYLTDEQGNLLIL